jgi:acyl-CoA dehydrogenase
MNFDLSDEQKMLADQVRALLAQRSSPDRLRALIGEKAEWDAALWSELCALGLPGAALPERCGGLGLSVIDLGVICEELGRANAAAPFFSSIVLAADAIALAGSAAQQDAYLPKLASGEEIGCFAYCEGARSWSSAPEARVIQGRISGQKWPVADAGVANLAVVLARDSEGGRVLVRVALDQPGVTRTRLDSFDQLRPHYRLDFDGADADVLEASSEAVIDRLFDRAAVQASFEAVGGAEACLYMARDYVMGRQIFGRPLASYQAVKHKLADIAVRIELARSNAYYGAWAADKAPELLPAAAAAARLTALPAFEHAARENLQLHGGIGYTFEANCHFYYRRERVHASALGNRLHWAKRLIAEHRAASAKAA